MSSSQCKTCDTRKDRRIDSPTGNLYSYSLFPWSTTPGLWIGKRHATVPFVYNQNPRFAACAFGNGQQSECEQQFGAFIYQFDEQHFDQVPRRFF